MVRTWFRAFVGISCALLLFDWILGIARIQWPWLSPVFVTANFPTAFGFLWLESQPTMWWQGHLASWVNDEIGQAIAFVTMVALQAAIYACLLIARPDRLGMSGSKAGSTSHRDGREPGNKRPVGSV